MVDSYRLLADDARLRFAGNIEGRDIPLGAVDVVVTDGFTGNVVLKLLEGTGAWLFDEIRQAATSSWQGKLGGLLLRPKLRPLRDKVNPETYGGSYLIGLRAIAVKAHGDSGLGRDLQRAAPRGARSARRADRGHRAPRASGAARRGYHRGAAHGYGRDRLIGDPGPLPTHPAARMLRSPGRTP